jgi:hypothetical protein
MVFTEFCSEQKVNEVTRKEETRNYEKEWREERTR